ncbi:MAG: hypothetical protein ACRC6T_10825 [Sarcina sp.]
MNKKKLISILAVSTPLILIAGFSTKYIVDKNSSSSLQIIKTTGSNKDDTKQSTVDSSTDQNNFFATSNTEFKKFLTLDNHELKATPTFISALYADSNSNGFILLDNKEFHFSKSGEATTGFLNIDGLKYFNSKGELVTGFQYINGRFYKFNVVAAPKNSSLKLDNTTYKFELPSLKNGVATTGKLNYGNIKLDFDDNGILQKIIDTKNNDTFSGQNLKSFVSKNPDLGKYINLNNDGFVINISPTLAKALHSNPVSKGWIELGHCNYHFDINGNLTKGFYTNPEGVTTLSNKYGEMDIGFNKVDNNFYYLAAQKGREKFTIKIDNTDIPATVWGSGSGTLTVNSSIISDGIKLNIGPSGKLKTINEI